MRAVTWQGREDVRVEDVPDPRIEEPTDAIVRITASALCGSDLHLYAKLAPFLDRGDVLGHEPVGVVEEVGPEVRHIAPGDRVVVPFNISCGHCFFCDHDLYSQCDTTQNHSVRKGASLFGYTKLYGHVPGGQAQYLRVPQAHFGPIKLSEDVSDTRASLLADVLPTAWQAVEYADLRPGATLGIWGLGPIGQAALRIAVYRGAGRIIAVDQIPERLELAKRRGAEVIDFGAVDDVTDVVWELTSGRGVDSAIDAVGMEAAGSFADSVLSTLKVQPDKLVALRNCLGSIRRGGTLSISGVYVGAYPMFPLGDLFDKQITLRMGQANVRAWSHHVVPLAEGEDTLHVDELVTHVLPLEEAPAAYEMFQKKRDGAVKVVFQP